jgi:hypothetical protein
MGFLSRLFGTGGDRHEPQDSGEHAVLLSFPLADRMPTEQEMSQSAALQEELEASVAAAGTGELDGDEWGEGLCVVFLYGPDADKLWESIASVLEKRPFPKGARAIRRYGPPGSREEQVDLAWEG